MNWNKVYFETLESTNKTAVDYPVYSVIEAGVQTAGRGRYGNNWISPPGNLYMSVVLPSFGDKTPLLAFVMAVSGAEALQDFNVQLKWPNDVLCGGQKIAGILLEGGSDKLIAGIGVNIISSPKLDRPYQASDLQGKLSRDAVRDLFLNALEKNLALFDRQGFIPIRDLWKTYAIGIDKQITVRLPNQQMSGIFKDLSLSGALLLELPDKTIKEITAGAVFLLDEGIKNESKK